MKKELITQFQEVRDLLPVGFAKETQARLGKYELGKIYKVAEGKSFCAETIIVLITLCEEELERRKKIAERLQKLKNLKNGKAHITT